MSDTPEQTPTSGESLQEKTIFQLKEYAKSKGIEVPYIITKKEDILNFIVKKESGVEETIETPKEIIPPTEYVPKPTEQKKPFEHVCYVTKAKKAFITVQSDGHEKFYDFNSNGVCGILIAKTQKEVDEIESSDRYGDIFFRVEDESKIPTGSTKVRTIVGARSVLTGNLPSPAPVDIQLAQLMAESKKDIERTGRI
jgi:hypothetical protein